MTLLGMDLESAVTEAKRHPLCPPAVKMVLDAMTREINLARTERDTMMRQMLAMNARISAVEGKGAPHG